MKHMKTIESLGKQKFYDIYIERETDNNWYNQ